MNIIQNRLTTRKDGAIEIHIKRKDGSKHVAIIDEADLAVVGGYRRWHVASGRQNRNYIATTVKKQKILLHRVILTVPEGSEVAFLNGNPYDCRRCNMLITNHATVMKQRNTPTRALSGERCVRKNHNHWEVHVWHNDALTTKLFRRKAESAQISE